MGAGVLSWGVSRRPGESASLVPVAAFIALATTSLVGLDQTLNNRSTGFCRASFLGDQDVCVPGAMVRADGTFANPNILAAAILLLLPLACLAVDRTAGFAARLAGGCVIVAGLGAMIATGSRGGVGAAAVGLVVWLIARRPSRRNLGVLAAVVTASVIAGICYVAAGGAFGPRGEVWRSAYRLLSERQMGVGIGRSAEGLRQFTDSRVDFEHAHNLWVAWFVDTGLLGGTAVILLTLVVMFLVGRGLLRGNVNLPYAAAALAAFATMSLADHTANAVRISTLLGVVIGYAIATATTKDSGVDRAGHRPPTA